MAEQEAAVDRLRVVQRFSEAMPGGDWIASFQEAGQMERMRAAVDEIAVPDLEVEGMVAGQGGFTSAQSGVDGLIEWWGEWLSPWESFTLEVERVTDAPKGVLIEAVQRGRLHGSDSVVESASGAVFFFQGDRVARIEFHIERDRARQAAGLD